MEPTPTAMDPARAEACAACGKCALSDAEPARGPIPYEIHVTVARADVEGFKSVCGELRVKPLFLALQLAAGGVASDVMTSSIHMGSDASAFAEVDRISRGLYDAGFDVVRTKIETAPWHPMAPSMENGRSAPPGCYFESHLAIACPAGGRERLETLSTSLGLHLSRNLMKANGDGSGTVMATARSYVSTGEDFLAEAERCRSMIEAEGFTVDKLIVEYAMFDSRVGHDAAWTGRDGQ